MIKVVAMYCGGICTKNISILKKKLSSLPTKRSAQSIVIRLTRKVFTTLLSMT